MPKMTVLMPVYNAERFLCDAIHSILNQSFSDFEFLIIDDGSTDESAAIIHSFSDGRIRYYRNKKNMGISASLNKGIELARCDLIARMDADDISYPQRLQKQYEFIQQHADGVLYSCNVKVTTEDGRLIRQDNFKPAYFYYNLTFICWIYHSSVVFCKKAVQAVGGYTVPYSEDFELFWQLTRLGKHYHLSDVLLDYRVTDQSLHQVVKKEEYARTQRAQVVRNIRYYAGEHYTLPAAYIACYQHDFTPLLQQKNVSVIADCIGALDQITSFIGQKENVNRDETAIREAAYYKQRFILQFFVDRLPVFSKIRLLVRLKRWRMLYQWLKSFLRNGPPLRP